MQGQHRHGKNCASCCQGESHFDLIHHCAPDWTYGFLVNHVASFAGEDSRADISSTFVQPFISKGLGKGRSVGCNTESTYNWETNDWSVPVNCNISQVTRFGKQLVSLSGGLRAHVETPGEGPEWGLRVVLTLLFPN